MEDNKLDVWSWEDENDDFLSPEDTVIEEEQPKEDEPIVEEPVEEEETEETVEEEEEETPNPWADAVDHFKGLGFLGEKEYGDLNEMTDDIEEYILGSIEGSVKKVIEEVGQKAGSEGAAFMQYLVNGGDPYTFMETYRTPTFNLKTEAGQEAAIRYYLKEVDGYDDDEIEDRVEYLIEKDRLEADSQKAVNRLKKVDEQQRAALAREQEEATAKAKEAEALRKTTLKNELLKLDNAFGFSFSPVERRTLYNYFTEPSVKQGNNYVTEFAKDFGEVYQSDPKKLAVIAKLLKNNFDFSELQKEAETQTAKKLKKTLQRREEGTKKTPAPAASAAVWDAFKV